MNFSVQSRRAPILALAKLRNSGAAGGHAHPSRAASTRHGRRAAPVPAAPLLAAGLCRGLSSLSLDWIKAEPRRVQAPLAAALAACSGLRQLSLEGYQGSIEEVQA